MSARCRTGKSRWGQISGLQKAVALRTEGFVHAGQGNYTKTIQALKSCQFRRSAAARGERSDLQSGAT